MKRRSTRNTSVRDRERSASLARSRSGSTDTALTGSETTPGRREVSTDSSNTDETDISTDCPVLLPDEATDTIIVSLHKNNKVTEKRVVDILTKNEVTPLPNIILGPSQIILKFNKEEDAFHAMGAFNQKMFGKGKNMKYFSSNILPEKNVFLYFKLKSEDKLKEIHILYEGADDPVIFDSANHKRNLLDAIESLRTAGTKWRMTGVFVCPQSYYILRDLLDSQVEANSLFHSWTDVTSCMRLQGDQNDIKFFSHDQNMLDKIHGKTISDGNQSSVLEDIFLNLQAHDVRRGSLEEGKFRFVMFAVEFEDIKTDKSVCVHMLAQSNLSLDITVLVDSKKEGKRTPKNKKLLNVEEGAQKIVKFLNATSETEPIILINTKGTESLPALLDLLCRGSVWSQLRGSLAGFVNLSDLWKQFTPEELKQSYRENIDKSWKVSLVSSKQILDYIGSKATEFLLATRPFYSKWMNKILEDSLKEFNTFDPSVYSLRLKKKLDLRKAETGEVSLEICPAVPWVTNCQFSLHFSYPDIESLTEQVSVTKKGTFSANIKNIASSDLKLPAKTLLGFAKLVSPAETEEESSDIDLYLLSSDEEGEEKVELKQRRKSPGDEDVGRGKIKKARITLGDSNETELITSLDEFKLKLGSYGECDPGPCITGHSTPEILKTSGTTQFLTDLKESLDKSFDIGDDFDFADATIEDVDSESFHPLDFREEEVCRGISPVSLQIKPQQIYKKMSDFPLREVEAIGRPLIQQLQSLSRLLTAVPVHESLGQHFPSLFSHQHLTPLCEILAKYGMFSNDHLDFELCDFGDKLIYEVHNFEGGKLSDLRTALQEFNKSNPRADLEEWRSMFSEKYESFRGINDILGEDFDVKTVQMILLQFASEFDVQEDDDERPVTKLKYFNNTELDNPADEVSSSIIQADPELVRREKILHYFDSRDGRGNIYLALRTSDEDKEVAIVKEGRLTPVSMPDDGDSESEFFLVHVSDYAGCNFALPLSAWELEQSSPPLLYTGFIVCHSHSQECQVAVIDRDELKLVVVDQMIMLENDCRSASLQQGSEVNLIMNNNFQPLACLAHPDKRKYDLQDISNWSDETTSFISETKNLPEIQDLITSLRITRLNCRQALLIKFADPAKLLRAKQIISKKSFGFETDSVKKMSWIEESFSGNNKRHLHRQILPANLQASKEALLRLKFLFYFTETRVQLLNKSVIIVEGHNLERVNLVKRALSYNLKKSKFSIKPPSKAEFLEIKSGQEICLDVKEKKTFSIELQDININEYNVHHHFDFECYKNEILAKVKIDAEKCITLELSNISKQKMKLAADENVLLLERKSSSKVSSKKKQFVSLRLIKTVHIDPKSVSFVEVEVVDFKATSDKQSFKIQRHPDFKNENIFIPDNQMRTISLSGKLKMSVRNKSSSVLDLSKGLLIGQIFVDKIGMKV